MRTLITAGLAGLLALGFQGAPAQDSDRTQTGTEVKTDVKTEAKPEVKTETKTTSIPFETKYIFNRDMAPGRVKQVTQGVNGTKTVTITKTIVDGKVTSTKQDVKTVPAKDCVFHMGRQGFKYTDRGSFTRAKVITMESTAYLPTDGSGAGITATGRKAEFGIVAVDPRQIKLGTLLFVEGYGFALAADTGGAIKGNRIDVCVHSRSQAMNWGRRKVKVHIFAGRHTKDAR